LAVGLGSLSAAAAAARAAAQAAPALEKVKVINALNSVFVLSWSGAKDAGIFAKHGIDLDVDIRPFAGYLASLPSKSSFVGTYSGLDAIDKINEGLDWVILGPGLTLMQDIIVRKDSPLQTVADLRGKKFGTFCTGCATFKCMRAALIDAHNFDLTKDTQLQQLAAPALMKFLEEGQVDAAILISSFTVNAEAEPDKFRVLFSPNEYWEKKTGYPIMWSVPLDAWRSWVDENPTRAKNFATAARESLRWLEQPANLRTAVKNYGKLAGISTPAAVDEYITWLTKKHMFMTDWDHKAVGAQWQFLDVCKRTGIISKVPPMDKYALFVES
jgi:ABC-type nitrate/sulfonate/bicarbonate transport system substrate-binding protein